MKSGYPNGAGTDNPRSPTRTLAVTVPERLAGRRLDLALAELLPGYSRARLQLWIREGRVSVDGRTPRGRDRVHGGEQALVRPPVEPLQTWSPEPIAMRVVHEDADLIVVDKPAGLVVHPGAGHREGTLANALLHRYPELATVPRAGVVHRLDKDTTGLMVIARTLPSHKALVAALKAREVRREYQTVVRGRVTAGGVVDAPLGRHRAQRTRMAVSSAGRGARTHYRVLARYRAHSHLRVRLETGRTHQIRVHLAHIGHPVVGDPTYGARLAIPAGASPRLEAALRGLGRQALHAASLRLVHPSTKTELELESPLPDDMLELLAALETSSS